jgi:CRP-like cAMP-binding protein
MNTAEILKNINGTITLDEAETEFLKSILISRPFKQGEIIIESGELARYIVFVNSGYLMTYYTAKKGTDHVVQFGSKGWWAGDIFSLSKEITTLYATKGLSEGEVLLIPRLAQNHLLENYPKFERYFRIIFQQALIRQQMRFIESHSNSAAERYAAFTGHFPGIEQFVPQKYIASYLGITPEFLSKVRKKVQIG